MPLFKALPPFCLKFMGGLVLACVLLCAGGLTYLRFAGIPEHWQGQIRQLLQSKRIFLEYSKLYMDETGYLVVRDARLLDPRDNSTTLCRVDRLRLGIEWFAWWRGEFPISTLEIHKGEIEIPLEEGEIARLNKVRVLAHLSQRTINLEQVRFEALKLRVKVSGDIPLDDIFIQKTDAKPAPSLRQRLARPWKNYRQINDEFDLKKPFELSVKITSDPETRRIGFDVAVDSDQFTWRGIPIDKFAADAFVDEQQIRVERAILETTQGEINAKGSLDLATHNGSFVLSAPIQPELFAPLLKGEAADRFAAIQFQSLPSLQLRLDWRDNDKRASLLHLDLDARDIAVGSSKLDRITLVATTNIAFDKCIIPEFTIEAKGDKLSASGLWDKEASSLKLQLDTRLNPTLLKAVLPSSSHPFLDSCVFEKSGPSLTAKVRGSSLSPASWKASGSLSLGSASYKGTALQGVGCDYEWDGSWFKMQNVWLHRTEGKGSVNEIAYHPASRILTMKGGTAQTHVQETAHIFGGDFEKSCLPYVFASPPSVQFGGKVDLGGGDQNDFSVKLSGAAMTYPFMGVLLPPDKISADLFFKGKQLTIQRIEADMHDGKFSMEGRFDFSNRNASFQSKIQTRSMDFQKVMRNLFAFDDVSGSMEGSLTVSGIIGDLRSLTGSGSVSIQNGYLTSIPFLGGLSALANTIIPDIGYAKAKQATADYLVSGGSVKTDNLVMNSATFTLINTGEYNFVDDQLDLDARINLRGPIGIVFFPISKILEYKGTGPMKNPTWRPKILGG